MSGSFLKVTPAGILSSIINVGQGSAGSGRGLALQLPEGVAPLPEEEFTAKPACAILAQQEENWVITRAEEA
ncbi:hypothetical protein [Xenorhabdus cabanillasii]|uniref:Uncharacterized protein n=1 Tax=Xenorhabdus cabanillasii JM26 TaxID=1427517 RepID=W1J7E8_9GAMM|nr:hypothetical protein [Xenorhabdus cabanillasii]CDL85791.1 conserved hypothetical protein [Xenorhabdus cabanillasii JM26]